MSDREFLSWLRRASPGETIVYAPCHIGAKTKTLSNTFRTALEAFNRGEVELVQRRSAKPGKFDYLAIKRRNVVQPNGFTLPPLTD